MKISGIVAATCLLASVFLAAGCDEGPGDGEGFVITASVDNQEVKAGTDVKVECLLMDGESGSPVDDATIVVTPADGATVDGLTVHTTKVGSYEVECRSEQLSKATSEPAAFAVIPADPAKTVATVAPENIEAGADATVTCAVVDAYGNTVNGVESSPEPIKDLTVSGYTVSSKVVGAYEITCSAPEGFADVEKNPAILQVEHGRPVTLDMTLNPDKDNYKVGEAVMVKWVVADAYGNKASDLPADIIIEPAEGLKLFQTKITVLQEGRWTVTVQLKDFDLSDSDEIICDHSAPELFIEWPPRGETVEGSPEVVVRGTVTDVSDGVTLDINGKNVTIGEDGKFYMPMTAIHGLNGLKFTVTDDQGFEYWTTRGFYYSDTWTSVDDETTIQDVTRDEGAMLFMGQDFLDDGDHDRSHPNDLATIIEILLASNVGGLLNQIPPITIPIPNIVNFNILGVGLQGDLNVEVQLRDISFGDPYVEIQTRDGGIATSVTLQPVTVGMDLKFIIKARATAFGNTYDLLDPSTSSGGSMSIGTFGIGLSLDINKTPGQEIQIDGKDFELTIENVQLDPIEHLEIDLGTIGPLGIDLGTVDLTKIVGSIDDLLMNWVVEPVINFLTPLLTNLLEPLVTELMGTALKAIFDQLVLDQPIDLPEVVAGKGTTPLNLHLAPSTIVFTQNGGTIGMELGFMTSRDVDHDPIGVIGSMTDEQNALFSFDPDPGFQAAIDIQTVNSLLFMIWQSGMLYGEIDLSSAIPDVGFGVGNLKITPDLYLPPILNDSAVGEDGMMSLELGDAFIKVQVDLLGNPQFFDMWLQLAIQVQIIARGSEIGIKFGKVTFFQTEFGDLGDLGGLLDMVLPMIPDLIKSIEGQEFTFPIPEIDLASIIPGIGGSSVIQLGNGLSTVRDGMVVFGEDLL